MPNTNNLKPENAEVVKKIRILRAYTRKTGFQTGRSVNALLAPLAPDDLVEVLTTLEQDPPLKSPRVESGVESGVRLYDPQ